MHARLSRTVLWCALAALVLTLTACGGGGGGGTPPPPAGDPGDWDTLVWDTDTWG